MKRWLVTSEDGSKLEQVFAWPEMDKEQVKAFLVREGFPEDIVLKEA